MTNFNTTLATVLCPAAIIFEELFALSAFNRFLLLCTGIIALFTLSVCLGSINFLYIIVRTDCVKTTYRISDKYLKSLFSSRFIVRHHAPRNDSTHQVLNFFAEKPSFLYRAKIQS